MTDDFFEIKEEDIEVNFYLDGEEYAVLKNKENDGTDDIQIVKIVEVSDDFDTIVSLTEEEYDKALDEYLSILEDLMEEENEN